MLCVYFGMRWQRREVAPLQGFALALIAVLWWTFRAVGGRFLAVVRRSGCHHRGMGWRIGRDRVAANMCACKPCDGGHEPLVIGAFGGVSLISPLVNLVVIPFFTLLLVPAILLGSALSSMQVAWGEPLLQTVSWLLEQSWPVWQWAADLPLALWRMPQLPWSMAALLCIGCARCVAPLPPMLRVAGVALCVPALVWSPSRPLLGNFDLTVLDVGQGLAVVVYTREHVLVYDTGPAFRSGRDTGELVVLPYLYSQGVRRIDTLIASHGDVDHVGGLTSVLQGLPTTRVLAGSSVKSPPLSQSIFKRCAYGQRWRWDGVEFAVLHPEAIEAVHTKTKDNDTSCVLSIRGARGSATIFGDIERASEQQLLRNGRIESSEIVVVPHHGSRTSSTPELIAAVQAKFALIGAGVDNRWGFPNPMSLRVA